MIKVILYLTFLLPLAGVGQTVHIQEEKIDYAGEVQLGSPVGVRDCIQQALRALSASYAFTWVHRAAPYAVRGSFHLRAPYQQLRIVHFTLEVLPSDTAYRYHLYEVNLLEGERGAQAQVLESKALLKGLDESGAPAAAAEHTLNEIDMDIEALLVRLQRAVSTAETVKSRFQ